jgi:GTPase
MLAASAVFWSIRIMFRVAIVGRPNVGKSRIFNRLTMTRKAIVGDQPGITRDRMYETAAWDEKRFEVVDTGGIIPDDREKIPEQVLRQAEIAMDEADLVLFVVDVRDGITPLDEAVNGLLRSRGKDYFLVVNKVDVPGLEDEALQFYALGVEEIYPISAEHREGVAPLVEAILERIPDVETAPEQEEIRVAIIGRPNVGKSSLLNRLIGRERSIVTDLPGTTRDAIDTLLQSGETTFRLVDTAGIRRKGKTEEMAEKLSVIMARKSLERADVVLLVIDAVEGATKLDANIGGYAHKAGKSIVIVVNKWDLVERDTYTSIEMEKEIRERMRFLDYAPMIFVSALSGQRVHKILELVKEAYQGRRLRVPTAELNQFFGEEVQPLLLSPSGGKKFPLKYAAQFATAPPTFVLFTRGGGKLHFSTVRFLVNQLRGRYGFFATPIRIIQRSTRRKSTPAG